MPKLAKLQGHDESRASGSTGREGIGIAGLAELGPDPAKKNTVCSSTLESLLVPHSTTTFSSCYIALSLPHLSLRATHHIHCFRMPGLDIEPAVIDNTRSWFTPPIL
jgi:hypothetical protein